MREIEDGLDSSDSLEKLTDPKRLCGILSSPSCAELHPSSSTAANATLWRLWGEMVRRQLPEYSLSANGSPEGGGGGTRGLWKMNENRACLLRGMDSATALLLRFGLSEAARAPDGTSKSVLSNVPDLVSLRLLAVLLVVDEVVERASLEVLGSALKAERGAGNTSSRTAGCCGDLKERGEARTSSNSSKSDEGDGDALCTRD